MEKAVRIFFVSASSADFAFLSCVGIFIPQVVDVATLG
jgi:hypothetical protein